MSIVFQKPHALTDVPFHYCPGCTHGIIHRIVAEVIDELIKLSKTIVEKDKDAENMGLTTYEYAFYSAVADNESAKELMGKDRLRELAVVLTETIRKNSSIRAKMKVAVKRLLRKYGYPPDMQQLATETVLKQAELIAEEIAHQ